MDKYNISRVYFNRPGYSYTLQRNVDLETAQAHCRDPETSSSTCTKAAGKRRTRQLGRWFDVYTVARS